MTDEVKKEEGVEQAKETAGEVKPQEAAKKEEAQKSAPPPKEEAQKSAPPPKVEAQKSAPPPKKEKPDKCEHCSKALGRVKWYYRDGGYYCARCCWKEFRIKQEEEKKKSEAPAPA
jgi:outer membrane biosynthesis protein TonB